LALLVRNSFRITKLDAQSVVAEASPDVCIRQALTFDRVAKAVTLVRTKINREGRAGRSANALSRRSHHVDRRRKALGMNRGFIALSFAVLLVGALTGCGGENLERADFNAYFYYPENNREEFLGLVTGLSACQRAASARAASLNMSRSTG
jgi:hypothetical protein